MRNIETLVAALKYSLDPFQYRCWHAVFLQIAAAEEVMAATGAVASEAAVDSGEETAAATVAAAAAEEDTAVVATKWEEGQDLWVQYC